MYSAALVSIQNYPQHHIRVLRVRGGQSRSCEQLGFHGGCIETLAKPYSEDFNHNSLLELPGTCML